jgi:phospholipase C
MLAIVALVAGAITGAFGSVAEASAAGAAGANPIKHVVVILEENHSFDELFGDYCVSVRSGAIKRAGTDSGCDGTTKGMISGGTVVTLAPSPDVVPASTHTVTAQIADIDGGKMDGFARTPPCVASPSKCYSQYEALSGPCSVGTCIPNLVGLANAYDISDRTFELSGSPSWGGHLYFAAATLDGFLGGNPKYYKTGPQPLAHGGGWGCDAGSTTQWLDSHGQLLLVPSCVPDATGSLGPNWAGYTGPHASYVPTIFDELDAAKLPWRIYGGSGSSASSARFQPGGYMWTICPSFAECDYTGQRTNLVPASQFVTDAQSGNLPTFSVVTPTTADSQHNGVKMSSGDDYIGQLVTALESGSDWPSTAVFVTYDDCGCFYDHVNPLQFNTTWGVRVPMVIVSPYAKPGYTDHGATTFAGILAFVEHDFGLPALNAADAGAYDYSGSFCFNPSPTTCSQAGVAAVKMIDQRVTPLTPAQQVVARRAARDDT